MSAAEDEPHSAQTLGWLVVVSLFGLINIATSIHHWVRNGGIQQATESAKGLFKPEAMSMSESRAASPAASARVDPAASLVQDALASGEWREVADAQTGKKYYFHKASGKVVWDLAEELAKK
eukprot:Hpha_TRINITY_DN27098_c0_g1::TRINITY_DN27098_c0_g1_i1::g.33190::m.33190